MANFVITYNIDGASERQGFVGAFERILTDLHFHKEITNQSTYFGVYSRRVEDLVLDLFNTLGNLTWREADAVTIYYLKVIKTPTGNIADIGRACF